MVLLICSDCPHQNMKWLFAFHFQLLVMIWFILRSTGGIHHSFVGEEIFYVKVTVF